MNKYIRNSEAPFEAIDDEVVVVSTDHRHTHRLNPTAALLWNELEQPRSEKTLADALTRRFDVTAEDARSDVAAFLNRLKKHDLIRTAT